MIFSNLQLVLVLMKMVMVVDLRMRNNKFFEDSLNVWALFILLKVLKNLFYVLQIALQYLNGSRRLTTSHIK